MRLTDDMRTEAAKLTDRATGYRLTGNHQLCDDFRRAANGLLVAVNQLEIAYAGEREALPPIETAAQFTKARESLGLSKVDVAAIMRLPNPETSGYRRVLRWEQGEVPGYALTMMEMLMAGDRPASWKKEGDEN